MRQKADEVLSRSRQNTSGSCQETLSDFNFAPAAFSLNQNGTLCLPLLSENQRLIWVRSDQINLQMDGAAELDAAFDSFPYLTQKQTAALAQRCSLHQDQVKVWFMAQRLRYGISWDYKDIQQVERKYKLSQGEEAVKNSKKIKKEGEARKKEKVKKKNGGKDSKVEAVEKNQWNAEKKRKKMMKDKVEKKRTKQGDDATEVEKRSEKEWPESIQTQKILFTAKKQKAKAKKRSHSDRLLGASCEPNKTVLQKTKIKIRNSIKFIQEWPVQKSYAIPGETLDASPSLIVQSQIPAFDEVMLTDSQTEDLKRTDVFPFSVPDVSASPVNSSLQRNMDFKTDVAKLKELIAGNSVADGCSDDCSSIFTPAPPPKRCTTTPKTGSRAKRQSQLAMMKLAFSNSQYPDSQEYRQLALVTGVQQQALVQWFSDMRYYVKKLKPRWMNEEQHRKALANIRYQQYLRALEKAQASGKETKMNVEEGKAALMIEGPA